MRTSDLLRIVWRRWVVIVLIVLLGLVVGGVISVVQRPVYQSTSQVYVAVRSTSSTQDLQSGSTFAQQIVKGFTQVADTPIVLNPVISELGLTENAGQLMRQLDVETVLDTSVITITAQAGDKTTAMRIANAVASNLPAVVDQLSPTTASNPVRLTTIQTATEPDAPVEPRVAVNLLFGALVGLAVGLVVALAREAFERRVRGPADVRALSRVDVIGSIPFTPSADKGAVLADASVPELSKAYRLAAINVELLLGRAGRGSVVVTAPTYGNAKSISAVNIAAAGAAAGRSVVLVDVDAARPSIGTLLQVDQQAPDLWDVVHGEVDVTDALRPISERFSALPLLRVQPDKPFGLHGDTLTILLATLERRFDLVVLSAPPLLESAEAALMSRSTGGMVVTAGAGSTTRRDLRDALATTTRLGAPTLGLVLTRVPRRGPNAG